MINENYSKTIVVSAPPEAAYRAITEGIEHWWTTPDRPISAVGDCAKFTFPPGRSYWTFEASVLTLNKYVELVCVDALHLHAGHPKDIEQEWIGTKVIWRIQPRDRIETEIRFEHVGLHPGLLCYEICESGWDFFFMESLQTYLDTGVGKPHSAAA